VESETTADLGGGDEPALTDANTLARWVILGGQFVAVGAAGVARAIDTDPHWPRTAFEYGSLVGSVLVAALGAFGVYLLVRFGRRVRAHGLVRVAAPATVGLFAVAIGVGSVLAATFALDRPEVRTSAASALGAPVDPMTNTRNVDLTVEDVKVPAGWEVGPVDDGIVDVWGDGVYGNVVAMSFDHNSLWTRDYAFAFAHECVLQIDHLPGFKLRDVRLVELTRDLRFEVEYDLTVAGIPSTGRMMVALDSQGHGVTTSVVTRRGTIGEHEQDIASLTSSVEAHLLD
jgi:hypothetical protein